MCDWIKDFLSNGHQVVRMGLNTGGMVAQLVVLSPHS